MRNMSDIQGIVTAELGEIISLEEIVPGVYEAVTKRRDGHIGLANDFYVVETDSPAVSEAAKKHGRAVDGAEDVLLFDIDDYESGRFIIEYEIEKYKCKDGQKPLKESKLLEIAVYGMECHADYFGSYPVPSLTPWGYTARYKTLENGIYWIETAHCQNVLSVCYPTWNSELTEAVKQMGKHIEADLEKRIDECFGNLYFIEEDACVAIFELLELRPHWTENGMINQQALMNAIWKYHSEYAVSYNAMEQAGGHDGLGLVLNALGNDVPLYRSLEKMMFITQDAGYDYLNI